MEKLKYSMEDFEKLCGYIPCGMGIFNIKTRKPVLLNDAYYQLTGYSEQEYMQLADNHFEALIVAEDIEIFKKSLNGFLSNQSGTECEYRMTQKNGSIRHVNFSMATLYSGNTDYVLCFFEDITPIKEHYSMLNLVSETTNFSICVMRLIDNKETLLYANSRFYELINETKTRFSFGNYKFAKGYVSYEDEERIKDALQKTISTGHPTSVSHWVTMPSGEDRYLHRKLSTAQLGENSHILVSIVMDMTDEMQDELLIKMERDRLKMVVEEMKTIVFEWDRKRGLYYYSGNLIQYAISQIPKKDVFSLEVMKNFIHPNDIEAFEKYEKAITQGLCTAEAKIRILMTSGEYKWIHILVNKIYNSEGKFHHARGIITDINDTQEENIKMNTILNTIPGGVCIIRSADTLHAVYFSDGLCRLFGHSRAEIEYLNQKNMLLYPLVHKDDIDNVRNTIQYTSVKKTPLNITFRVKHALGQYIWINLYGEYLREDKAPVYYCILTQVPEDSVLYRNLSEDADVGVVVAESQNSKIIYANKSMYQLLGHGSNLESVSILGPSEIASLNTDTYTIFYRELNERYLQIRAKSTYWHNKKAYYFCAIDITSEESNRKQLEEANEILRQQIEREKAQIRMFAKKTENILRINATKGIIEIFNASTSEFTKIYNKSDEEALFSKLKKAIIFDEDWTDAINIYDFDRNIMLYNSGIIESTAQSRYMQPDGSYKWYEATAKREIDSKTGDIVILVLIKDIDTQKRISRSISRIVDVDDEYIVSISRRNWGMLLVALKDKYRKNTNIELGKIYTFDFFKNELQKVIKNPKESQPVEKFFKKGYLESLLENQSVVTQIFTRETDSKKICYKQVRAHYIDDTNEEIVVISRDVTEIYEKEQQQKEALIKANVAKSAFLSTVSHDMRTPLNGVLGLTDLMLEREQDIQNKADLIQLKNSGQYLLTLINDTLDMSKIESGNFELHPSVCDGKTLFEETIDLLRPSLQQKQIQLIPVIHSLNFKKLYVDVGRIRQLFMNIIGNSIKFSPEGSQITMTIEQLYELNGVMHDKITIRDEGIGMSKEFLPHLFDAFKQETNEFTPSVQGTGLGMGIVKKIVEIMGGEIWVDSELGKGTIITFTINMPIATEEQIKKSSLLFNAKRSNITLTGKNFLICEDHKINAMILKRLLLKDNCEVVVAENGQVAVQAFINSEIGFFDAVFMDIHMPVLDGLEATKQIRNLNRPDAKKIPIIAMTGNAFEDDKQTSYDAGMTAHLTKPIDMKLLHQTLQELL